MFICREYKTCSFTKDCSHSIPHAHKRSCITFAESCTIWKGGDLPCICVPYLKMIVQEKVNAKKLNIKINKLFR